MNIEALIFDISKAAVRKNYLSTRAALQRSAKWSEAEIAEYQDRSVKQIVEFASRTIPYYKTEWGRLGVDVQRVMGVRDLARIPLLTKQDINKNLDAMLNPDRSIKRIPSSSGGSTGIPLRYFMTPKNALHGSLILDRGLGLAGYKGGDRLAIIAGGSLVGPRKSIRKRLVERLANLRYFSSYGMSEQTLECYAKEIVRFQPKFIRGYASAINALASFMEANGTNKYLKISAIFSTAEMLVPNVRANVESVFQCKVFDGWGLNDGGATAFECREHHGMHIDPERAFVEVVEDESTVQYGPGVGKVVVTSLLDELMPFIRYETGDLGRIERTGCPCGLATPRLFLNYGRTTDQLKVGGRIIGAPVLTVLMGALPVAQYQVAKTGANELTFRIIRAKSYSMDAESFLRRSVRERLGPIDVVFDYVGEIIPSNGNKHKFLVDEYAER